MGFLKRLLIKFTKMLFPLYAISRFLSWSVPILLEDEFKERVTEYFNDWKECEEPTAEQAKELWDEITDQVLSRTDDGEIYAYQAAHDFDHEGFQFQDFFDGGGTERYTFSYLWCLYAIAWGIQQYDSALAKAA